MREIKLHAIDEQVVLEVEGTMIPVMDYKISSSTPGGAELEITIPVGVRFMEAEIATIQEPLLRQSS